MLPRACVALLVLLTTASSPLVAADSAELASLRTKAEKGNAIAQYNLGLAYLQAPADLPEAFVWLTLASEKGSTGKALNALADTLTDAQLTEGKRRLEAYRSGIARNGKVPLPRAVAPQANGKVTTLTPSATMPVVPVTPAGTSLPVVVPVKADAVAAADAVPPGAELAAVREDLRQLGDELAVAWKENNELKNELTAAQTKAVDSNVRLAAQAEALSKLEDQLAKAASAKEVTQASTAALTAAEQEIKKWKAAAATSATKVTATEASLAVLNSEKARWITERDAGNAARSKAQAELDAQAQANALLRQKLAAADTSAEEGNRATAQMGAIKSQLAATEAARLSLAAEKSAAEQAVSRLTAEKDVFARKLAQAVDDAAAREAQSKTLASELQAARKDIEDTRAVARREAEEVARANAAALGEVQAQKIAELNQRLTAGAAAVTAAEEAKASAHAALRRAEFAAKESSAQIADLKARVQALDAARVTALAEKNQAADRAKRLTAELEAAPREAAAVNTRLSAAAAELTRVTAERNDLLAARAKAESTAVSQASEIAALKQQLAAGHAAADDAARDQAAAEKVQTQLDAAQAEVKRTATQLAASEAMRAELAERNSAAASAVKAGLDQIAVLRAEMQSRESGRAQAAVDKEAVAAQLATAAAAVEGATRQAEALNEKLAAATAELEVARQNAADVRDKFAASESVRRDFGNQLNALRAELKETQAAVGASQITAARLADENALLKARLPLEPALNIESFRAQIVAAEQKAADALDANRALTEENARLKAAHVSSTPSAGRAVLVTAPTKPAARASGNVPAGANATLRPVSIAPATPPPTVTPQRTHVIVAGDTLTSISARYYNTPSRWPEILAANRNVMRNERTLVIGRILRIP
jgi:chromosome segregation ATPase